MFIHNHVRVSTRIRTFQISWNQWCLKTKIQRIYKRKKKKGGDLILLIHCIIRIYCIIKIPQPFSNPDRTFKDHNTLSVCNRYWPIMQKQRYKNSRRALISLRQFPVGCLVWDCMPAPLLGLLIPVYRALSVVGLETRFLFYCKWKAPQQGLLFVVPKTDTDYVKNKINTNM